MQKIVIMLVCLLIGSPLGAKNKNVPARLTIIGPLAASAGQPLPIHLKFDNISTDKKMTIVKNCQWSSLTWDIRDAGGNKLLHPPIMLDCHSSALDLGPSMWHEWTVDPSRFYRFPKTGTYFFTAMFNYKLENSQTKIETLQTVISNTILINIR